MDGYDDNRLPDVVSNLADDVLCNLTTMWLIKPSLHAVRTLDRPSEPASSASTATVHTAEPMPSTGSRDPADRPHIAESSDAAGPTRTHDPPGMSEEHKTKKQKSAND